MYRKDWREETMLASGIKRVKEFVAQQKNTFQLFFTNIIILLVFWGGLAHDQYNADTVYYRFQETGAAINVRLEEGRYLLALMNYVLPQFGINVANRIGITVLCNIILFGIALSIMYFLVSPERKINYFLVLCVDLVFVNVFASEMFMFAETLFGFGFGYLFSALAVWCFSKKRYLNFILCLIIGVCFYQYTIIIAAILLLFVVGREEKWHLSFAAFRKSFWGSAVCLIIGFLNMESTKVLAYLGILSKEEVLNEQQISLDISDKLFSIVRDTYFVLYDAKGLLMGAGIPFIVSIVTVGLILIYVIRSRNWNRLLYVLLLSIACFVLWIILPLVRDTYNNPPRMSFSFFMIQGLFLVLAYSLWGEKTTTAETEASYNNTGVCFINLLVMLYVLVQLLSVQNIVNNRYVSKTLDETYARLMYQRILEYEDKNGINVTKLAVCNDQNEAEYYSEVGATLDSINERILGKASWSIVCNISGRNFENVSMDPEVYSSHFEGKDWDHFDLEQQLVIQNDTAYWCIY